jgi:hypothetical protein
MGGYLPHPSIDAALAAFRATGPIYDTEAFERLLIGLAYSALRWRLVVDSLDAYSSVRIEERADDLIRMDVNEKESET